MKNDPNHSKSQGTRFHEFLQEHNISDEQFHTIMKKMGLSRNTAQSFISKEMNDMRAPNICLLQNLFGVPPSMFDLEDDFFNSEYSYNEGELYCFNYKKEESDTYRPFVENFFRAVNKYLLSAQKRLCVSDYFVKNQGLVTKEHLSFYKEKSRIYFERLEHKISENPKFEYKRIVQLPLHFDPRADPARFVVEGMLPEAFGHFARCLQQFPDQCSFYIITKPFRLYTYYLVDDNVTLTEYHRFDRSGIPMPDTLFVNIRNPFKKESIGGTYFESCFDEFERIINNQNNAEARLTHHLMKQKTYEAIHELQHDIEKKKREIESNQQKIEGIERRNLTDNVLIINELLKIGHQLDTEKEQLIKQINVFREKLEKAGWTDLGLIK